MRVLLFLCVSMSLLHTSVQQDGYLTMKLPRQFPQKNPNDHVFITMVFNLGSLDKIYSDISGAHSTLRSTDDTVVFLNKAQKPTNLDFEVLYADFKNPEEAKTILNNYVSKITSGKINNFFSSVDKNTDAVILSYADKWKVPADEGTEWTVQLNGKYNAFINKDMGFTMIEIPHHSHMSAVYTVPEPGREETVETALTSKNLEIWRNSMTQQWVNKQLPRATVYCAAALTTETDSSFGTKFIKRRYAYRASMTYP